MPEIRSPASLSNQLPIGVVFRLDPSSQQLKPLPDEQWKSKGKTGWVTVSGILVISGRSATFRIKTGEKSEFVFISGTPENARLYHFDQKTNERYKLEAA